jgi:hypothetical protein
MVTQAARKILHAVCMSMLRRPDYVRQGMNATFALGMVSGRFRRWRMGVTGEQPN